MKFMAQRKNGFIYNALQHCIAFWRTNRHTESVYHTDFLLFILCIIMWDIGKFRGLFSRKHLHQCHFAVASETFAGYLCWETVIHFGQRTADGLSESFSECRDRVAFSVFVLAAHLCERMRRKVQSRVWFVSALYQKFKRDVHGSDSPSNWLKHLFSWLFAPLNAWSSHLITV